MTYWLARPDCELWSRNNNMKDLNSPIGVEDKLRGKEDNDRQKQKFLLLGRALLVKLYNLGERLIRHFSMNSGKRDIGDLQQD